MATKRTTEVGNRSKRSKYVTTETGNNGKRRNHVTRDYGIIDYCALHIIIDQYRSLSITVDYDRQKSTRNVTQVTHKDIMSGSIIYPSGSHMTKLRVAFRNFAHSPKTYAIIQTVRHISRYFYSCGQRTCPE